jgi:hypothetical protein
MPADHLDDGRQVLGTVGTQ